MLKLVIGVLGLTLVNAPVAAAQQRIDPVLFEQGQQLYQQKCAFCHHDRSIIGGRHRGALAYTDNVVEPVILL